MSTDRTGLLTDSERTHVDKRLELLDQEPIVHSDELFLVSAVHRAHYSRDALVMSSLGMSMLVVGSLATNDDVAFLLIGCLVLAGLLGTVPLIAIRQADAARRAAEDSLPDRRGPSLRALPQTAAPS